MIYNLKNAHHVIKLNHIFSCLINVDHKSLKGLLQGSKNSWSPFSASRVFQEWCWRGAVTTRDAYIGHLCWVRLHSLNLITQPQRQMSVAGSTQQEELTTCFFFIQIQESHTFTVGLMGLGGGWAGFSHFFLTNRISRHPSAQQPFGSWPFTLEGLKGRRERKEKENRDSVHLSY